MIFYTILNGFTSSNKHYSYTEMDLNFELLESLAMVLTFHSLFYHHLGTIKQMLDSLSYMSQSA